MEIIVALKALLWQNLKRQVIRWVPPSIIFNCQYYDSDVLGSTKTLRYFKKERRNFHLLFHQVPVHNNATRKVNQQKEQKARLPLRSKRLRFLRTRRNLHSLNQERLRRQRTFLQLNQGINENKISQQGNQGKINQKSQCLLWPWLHSQVWILHSTRNQRPVGWQK